VAVRGFGPMLLFKRCRNVFDHAVGIPHHFIVPIPEHGVAHRFQSLCSLGVGLCPHGMLPAIEFDDQLRISAEEIDDEAVKGKLSEFPSAETAIAQTKPQHPFSVRLIAA